MVIVGRITLPLGAWAEGCRCRGYDWQSEFSSIATGAMTFGRVPCASSPTCVAAGDRPMRPCSTRGRCGRPSGRQAQCHHRRARSHGDREFLPYREDHTDAHSRWLVVAFPEPSRQTLMRLHRGRTYRGPRSPLGPLHAARRRPVPTPVGPDGFARLAGAGARPGCGPRVEALSVHRQLVEAGFLLGTDDEDDQ